MRSAVEAMTEAPPLFKHQEEAVDFVLSRGGSGCLFHDPGLGKTRTALHTFFRLKVRTPILKLLVVCPLSLINAAWREDLKKFFGEAAAERFFDIHDEGLPDMLPSSVDFFAVNYEFFQREENVQKFIAASRHLELMAVLDESSKIKNHASLTTKHLLAIRNLFKHRVVMSGTPAPNSEEEYWAQLEFVRPNVLGKSFNKFKRTYFHLRGRGGVPINTGGMIMSKAVMADLFRKQGAEWAILPEKREALFREIGPWIHAAKKEECLDLPDQIDETRLVQMGPKQKAAYRQMKNLLVAEIQGQDVVAQVALAKLMKLREITSGFAISENQEIVETECPKLAALEEILDELGDRQAIIWCQFTWEIERIQKFLHSKEQSFADLYCGTRGKEESISGFIDGKYRYLIANPHSAAHGLTFVNCSHQIFFSLDYSWEAYEQARARTHRAGQKNICVYYHIMADGTIDQEILEVLRKKGDAQEIVFRLKSPEILK